MVTSYTVGPVVSFDCLRSLMSRLMHASKPDAFHHQERRETDSCKASAMVALQ